MLARAGAILGSTGERGGSDPLTDSVLRTPVLGLSGSLLEDFGEKKGATRAQIALAWLAAKKPWIVPIPGTTNLAHSREYLSSINVEFTPEDLREFEAAFARVTVHGGRMDARQMDQIGKD
jgi:diketogulonate reductase-like aldo/keto reductase